MLTSVDNQDVTPLSLDKINSMIKGPVGSSVVITLKSAQGGTKTVTLTRRQWGT